MLLCPLVEVREVIPWLQMQADIFQAEVIQLENEQGPALVQRCLQQLDAAGTSHLRRARMSLSIKRQYLHQINSMSMYMIISFVCIKAFIHTQ